MTSQSRLTALPSVDAGVVTPGLGIEAEIPDMPTRLSAKEKKVWNHLTSALLEYGLIHKTDGLTLTVIVRTFCEWVDATKELEQHKRDNGGSYITESRNGYRSPHPLYYVVRDLKKSLLTWLPEAALTIPSFMKIKGDQIVDGAQGALFDDPVSSFRDKKAGMGIRVVGGNGNK